MQNELNITGGTPAAPPGPPAERTIEWDTYQIAKDEIDRLLELANEGEADTLDRFASDIEDYSHEVEDEDALDRMGHADRLKAIWAAMSDCQREKVVQEDVWADGDLTATAWESVVECLTEEMTALNPEGDGWYAEGRNMGWQHRSGYSYFRADDGEKFLRAILPKTDCTFTITCAPDAFHIRNAHHDAPTGEFYTARPFALDRGVTFAVQPALYEELERRIAAGADDGEGAPAYEEEEAIFEERRSLADDYEVRVRVVYYGERARSVAGFLFEVELRRGGELIDSEQSGKLQADTYLRDWINDKMEVDFNVHFRRADS